MNLKFNHAARCLAIASMGLLWSLCGHVVAATFIWDANTLPDGAQDGGGTWQNGAGNWFDETNTVQNQNWSNAAANTAVFGAGSAGAAITVSGTVETNGMAFRPSNNTAYSFSGGTISMASGSAITVHDGATAVLGTRLTFNSSLTGSNITIQKAAGASLLGLVRLGGSNTLSGTLTLTAADTGGIFVEALSLNALPSATLSSVNVSQNASLILATSGNWAVPFTLSGTGAGGRGAIRFDTNNITLSGAITLAGNTLLTQNTNAVTTIINSAIGESAVGSVLSFGTQGGTGTIALAGANTFTGGVNIDVTNIRIDNAAALNTSAPNRVTFANTALAKNLSLNGTSITIGGLASLATGAGTGTVRNQNVTPATITIQSAADTSFNGVLADGTGGGALSVVKTGAFSQTLGGANTFTGGLTLNQGTLNLNSATALGATASTFTINGGALGNTSGAAVVISNNNPVVINGDFSAAPAHALDLGAGPVSLGSAAGTSRTITVGSGTLTLGGNISDGTTATALTKSGTGLLVLGGSSSYSGITSVTGGNLRVRSNGALGGTAQGTVVNSGSRLQMENNITITGESLITPYLENVSGNNTWAGNVRGAIGAQLTLDAASGTLTIAGNVDASSTDNVAHTFNLTGAGNGEIQGILSNTLSVNKTGSGTWVFSGANSYANVTNVSAGTLQVGVAGSGQTGSGAVTVAANATLSGTGTVRGSAFTLNANANLRPGDGVADSAHGTLTFTPPTSGTYNLASGSKVFLGVTTATANDPTFGGYTIGSNDYNNWLDNITGSGSHDKLVFNGTSGTLTVAGNISVLPSGYTASAGDVFNLLDWSALLGIDFSAFSVGSNYRDGSGDNGSQFDLPDISGNGLYWDISRFTVSGNIVVVPEPGRMVLLIAGLAGVLLRRRRV